MNNLLVALNNFAASLIERINKSLRNEKAYERMYNLGYKWAKELIAETEDSAEACYIIYSKVDDEHSGWKAGAIAAAREVILTSESF